MEVNIKNPQKTKVEIRARLTSEEFKRFIKRATKELGENMEAEGFRKGKVPPKIIKDKAGEDAILNKAADMAVKEKYPQIISEKDIEPISQPKVEILKMAKGNDFEFKVTTQILPEIELPDYKSIASKVESKEIEVSDKELQNSLNWLRKSRAEFTPLEREAKKDDFVEIEYQSPQIKGGQNIQDGFILGEGHFIPGFEEKITGMKKAEEKEFSLTFPDDFQRKELAGKKTKFKLKVTAVKKRKIPELNNEFASSLGKFDNVKALKENVKKGLTQEKEKKEQQRRREEILKKIAEKTDIEIPQKLIESEKERLMKNLKNQVSQNLQISFDEYLDSINKKEKELKNSLEKEAKKRIRNFLLLRQIGKKENISVSDQEVEKKAQQDLSRYSPEQKEKVDISRLKQYTKGALYNEKVFEKLENLAQESN